MANKGWVAAGNVSQDEILVKFQPGVDASTKAKVHKRKGGVLKKRATRQVDVVKVPPGQAKKKIAEYQVEPEVLYAEIDGTVQMLDAELDNSWGVKQIGAGTVQDQGITGQGVKVAVLDTGIDYNHPELLAVYRGGYNFINDTNNPMDDNGHGTHCAGIIAAARNGVGVVGVSPGVQLYALKVLNSAGSGSWSDIISALDWCIANGIQVTSNSYGGSDYSIILDEAFQEAWAAGILSIAAAGNSGGNSTTDTTAYPARCNSVVAVAATDVNKQRASFSSTGPATEVSAPGVNIYSTVPGGYGIKSGTSMVCPHVSGVAALVKSAHPSWNNETIRGQIRAAADDLGSGGHDWLYGYGLVNAARAVGALISNPPPAPDVPPRIIQTVTTIGASNISSTSATLNGYLESLGSYSRIGCWLAGAKVGESSGINTPMQWLTAPGPFSASVTGLLPSTQYYFVAIAYNGVQAVVGNQIVFTTLAGPAPTPTVISVFPSSGTQGQVLSVAIGGTNLTGASAVSLGAGITVNGFTVNSSTQITASITIDAYASLGARDVSVTTPLGTGTLAGGFEVLTPPPPPTPDFNLSVSPSSQNVKSGQTARYTVKVSAVNGYNLPVTLSVSVPSTMAYSFSANPVVPTGYSTLNINVGASARGSYRLTITAIGQDGTERSVAVTLKRIGK